MGRRLQKEKGAIDQKIERFVEEVGCFTTHRRLAAGPGSPHHLAAGSHLDLLRRCQHQGKGDLGQGDVLTARVASAATTLTPVVATAAAGVAL